MGSQLGSQACGTAPSPFNLLNEKKLAGVHMLGCPVGSPCPPLPILPLLPRPVVRACMVNQPPCNGQRVSVFKIEAFHLLRRHKLTTYSS